MAITPVNINKLLQLRRCLQLYAQTITDESQMMEVADIYPTYKSILDSKKDMTYGLIFSYGVNADGETQLYTVISKTSFTPQEDWTPDTATSLYKKIGFTPTGYNIWTQPLGATDAYTKGDIVSHKDKLWISTYDGANVWEPGVYGWVEYTESA